jgi:lipopolysaccharide transport system ATP-binding protein
MDNKIVTVKNLTKEFVINSGIRSLFAPRKLKAVNNVTFSVAPGEFIGIIGRNGSGKSTLLKLIAGILPKASGQLHVNGSVAPFLELGLGFQEEFTGRENIYIYSALLGLNKDQVESNFDDIVGFSGLTEFIDSKLKIYSSGMQARLAFSIAAQTDSDILAVDEVLAAGDIKFRAKCYKLFADYKTKGKTIFFVSHELESIRRFSDRVIVMDRGKILKYDIPEKAIESYNNLMLDDGIVARHRGRFGNNLVQIEDVEFLDIEGNSKDYFNTNEQIIIRIHYKPKEPIENPVFGVAIYKEDSLLLSATNTKISNFETGRLTKKSYIDYIVRKSPFLTGIYYVTINVYDKSGLYPYDHREQYYSFRVKGDPNITMGVMKLQDEWKNG